jgi:hypothetical protein
LNYKGEVLACWQQHLHRQQNTSRSGNE